MCRSRGRDLQLSDSTMKSGRTALERLADVDLQLSDSAKILGRTAPERPRDVDLQLSDCALKSYRTATERSGDVDLPFGFAGYDEGSEACRLHGDLARQNPPPVRPLLSCLRSLGGSERLLICAECLNKLLRLGQKANKRRSLVTNGRLVEFFSVSSIFLEQILKKMCRFDFVPLERPLVLFVIPECCLKTKGVPKGSFDSGFSYFLQLPNPLTFKEFLNLCQRIVAELKHRSNLERCICASKKSNFTEITAYLSLLFGVYLYISLTEKLDRVQKCLLRHRDSRTKKYIYDVMGYFKQVRTPLPRRIETQGNPLVIRKSNYPTAQSASGISTGKEEIETIDGVSFITFETESDMLEFTLLEHDRSKNICEPPTKDKTSGRIVPTKTEDITKIKGWRNKLFFTDRVRKNAAELQLEKTTAKTKKDEKANGKRKLNVATDDIIGTKLMDKIMKFQLPYQHIDLSYFPIYSDSDTRLSEHEVEYRSNLSKWAKKMNSMLSIKMTRYFRNRLGFTDFPETESESDDIIEINSSSSDESSSARRPQLSLLGACKLEDDFEGNSLEEGGVKKLPLIFPCSSESDDHSSCFEGKEFSGVRLGMILAVGYGRPIGQMASENLELLREDATVVDRRWATIAASAFCCNPRSNRTIKRFLIPVVSKQLLDVGRDFLQILPETSESTSEINEATWDCNDVEKVVRSLVDYVVRKEEFEEITIPSDPDIPSSISSSKSSSRKYEKTKVERELSRLINVTLVDECRKDYSYKGCGNEYCIKGCICHSLDGKVSVVHCRKESCMFDCTCQNKEEFTSGEFNLKNSLAKEESSWHQTVICKNNDVFEIRGEKSKSKRQKKLPTRYRNNVLLGKEMSSVSPSTIINWRHPHLPSKIAAKRVETKAKSSPGAVSQSAKISSKPSKEPPNVSQSAKTKNIRETPKNSSNKSSAKTSKISPKEESPKSDTQPAESSAKEIESSQNDSQTSPSVSPSKTDKRSDTKNLSSKKISKKTSTDDTSGKPSSKNGSSTPHVETNVEVECPESDASTPVVSKKKALNAKKKEYLLEKQREIAEQKLKLGDVYIWCSIHFCYLCPCQKYIYLLKRNVLVWKPYSYKDHITIPQMADLMRDGCNISTLHIYNLQDHSARTFGSVINYTKRNSSQTFKMKRAYEVEHFVLSCSNSFMKVEVPIKKNYPKSSSFSREQENPEENVTVMLKKPYNNQKSFDSQTFFSKIKTKKINFNLNCDPKNLPRPTPQEDTENQDQPVFKKKYYRIGPKHYDSSVLNKHPRPVERLPKYTPEQLQTKVNQRKKYRIGPKHFNSSGNYRTIVTKHSMRAGSSGTTSQSIRNSLGKDDCITLEDSDSESEVPEQGLLCLTRGFGYLPVKEYSHDKLVVQDPLASKVYHSFKDVEAANVWFNKFFKTRMLFEDLNIELSWVLAKKGILMKSKPFDKSLLEKGCPKMINSDGILVDKATKDPLAVESFRPNVRRVDNSQGLVDNIVDLINIASNKRLLDDTPRRIEQPSKKIKLDNIGILEENTVYNCEPVTLEPPNTIIGSPSSSTSSDDAQPKNPKKSSSFLRIDSTSSLAEGCFIPLVASDSAFQLKNEKTPDSGTQKKTSHKKSIVLTRGNSAENSLLKQKRESLNK